MSAATPDPSHAQILAAPMPQPNDADAASVLDYLIRLLAALWAQGADFDGKRPFGASVWKVEVYGALVKAGFVAGSFDEDGFLQQFSRSESDKADVLIARAITSLKAGG